MSDIFSYYDCKKLKYDICVDSEHSLAYIKKQKVDQDELFITIHVTNECLKSWYDFKVQEEVNANHCTFVNILNAFLREKHAIIVKEDYESREPHTQTNFFGQEPIR